VLNRRHIRIRVLQTIYAMHQSGSDHLEKQERFLLSTIENIQDLYLLMLTAMTEMRLKEEKFLDISSKKHLASKEEKNPNKKFVENRVLLLLENNKSILSALEDRRINVWVNNDDYIHILLNQVKSHETYEKYMNSGINSFEEDRRFVEDIFYHIIAPNEKLYDYLEDHKISWVDDIPLVNTLIQKQLRKLKDIENDFQVPKVYKDEDDMDFAKNLFRKTVLNEKELEKEYVNKTPNWDTERIAELDTIILKMAICEFLRFPSIPIKVTINEYLEIAKEYSTPKSSIFINGILDNLVKDYQSQNKLNKAGRGLM
jgi:N utilization substance protein B